MEFPLRLPRTKARRLLFTAQERVTPQVVELQLRAGSSPGCQTRSTGAAGFIADDFALGQEILTCSGDRGDLTCVAPFKPYRVCFPSQRRVAVVLVGTSAWGGGPLRARNEMAAMPRTPVFPEAVRVGALSAEAVRKLSEGPARP